MRAATGAGSRWKLAICASCSRRRMMPAANTSCLSCIEKLPEKTMKRPPSVEVPALKVLREVRGLSVSQLAWFADVNYTTVMRLERDALNPQRAHHRTARSLAAALGVPVEELRRCRRAA